MMIPQMAPKKGPPPIKCSNPYDANIQINNVGIVKKVTVRKGFIFHFFPKQLNKCNLCSLCSQTGNHGKLKQHSSVMT